MVSAVILLWINIMLYFDKDRLSAYLKAITVWTLYMFLGTEILSFARKLDFMGLIMLWLILDIILFSTVVFGKRLDLKNYREWGGGTSFVKLRVNLNGIILFWL